MSTTTPSGRDLVASTVNSTDQEKVETIEKLKALLREKDIEIQSLRLRQDGMQTVSKLLQESRAENKILKEKNSQLERTVDQLTAKLQRTGANHSVGSLDDDIQSPVPSRQLVENLVRENNRLKHQLNNPLKVDEMKLQAGSLRTKNEALTKDKNQLEKQVKEMRSVMESSGDAKDAEILRLREQLSRRDQDFHQKHSALLLLDKEINHLRGQLTTTANACIRMEKQLPNPSKAENADRSHKEHEKMQLLIQENEVLKREINSLHTKLESRATTSTFNNENEIRLIEENQALRKILQDKEAEIISLKEREDHLRHQMEVYQEDFRIERGDREISHQKYEEKLQRLSEKSKALSPLKTSSGKSTTSSYSPMELGREVTPPIDYQEGFTRQPPPLSAGNNSTFYADSGAYATPKDMTRGHSYSPRRDEMIKCYRCGKEYLVENQHELTEHLEICHK